METAVEHARHILIFPSAKYLERFSQLDGDIPSGAKYEGMIISGRLFQEAAQFRSFGIVLIGADDAEFIPKPFVGCPRYEVMTDKGADALIRWLTDQPAVAKPPLGDLLSLPPGMVHTTALVSFSDLCAAIRPLMHDNRIVFESFGPRSATSDLSPVGHDLTMWYKMRSERIVPNNRKIAELVRRHYGIVPAARRAVFDKLLSHIEAFEEHCSNPNLDYGAHQFPREVVSIVERGE